MHADNSAHLIASAQTRHNNTRRRALDTLARLNEGRIPITESPRPSGDSVPWEGWSHVREYVEEVPGRAP